MEIALKEVSGSFHPLQMTFTRFLAGGLFLIPFAVRTLKKKKASLNWKDLPGFLLLGFVGMVLGVPVFAMFYSVVSRLVRCGLKKRGLPLETEQYLGRTGPLAGTGPGVEDSGTR